MGRIGWEWGDAYEMHGEMRHAYKILVVKPEEKPRDT